jgi:type VI protein secretion system component VasK
LNTWAIHQIAASTVALFYCLQALMIALFAWVLLGEQLTVRVAVGGLLIMAGLFTVTWSLDRQRKKDARLALEQQEEEQEAAAAKLLDAGNDYDDNDEKTTMMKMKTAMEKKSVDGTMLVMELSQDGAWVSPTSPPSPEHQEKRRRKSGEAEYGTFV